ncbi:MAG: DUF1919 domain-containing protein [Clostridia bacterium]|nr:DUF1919 domain-containing protein [Clostridia bacterium]
MKGKFLKRKLNKFRKQTKEKIEKFFYETRRFFVKKSIKNKDFSIISNNCWAGRAYQYLDMPYLSPTAGLYFFAPDYIKFVSDLRRYLDTPLRFISPEESKYYEEIKKRNQIDKPIGILDDVEIVFLHYKTKEEAEEKWNRRKERVNFDNIIIKFSRMDLCSDKEIDDFCNLEFENKFVFNTRKQPLYSSEIYWKGQIINNQILNDTVPFPQNINLTSHLNKPPLKHSQKLNTIFINDGDDANV